MKRTVLALTFLLLLLSPCFSQKAVNLSLQAGNNNKSVSLSWQYNENHINKDNFSSAIIYKAVNNDSSYYIIANFQSIDNHQFIDIDDVDLSLKQYSYFIAILTKTSQDAIISDTLSPIYLSIKEVGQGNNNPSIHCPNNQGTMVVYRKYYYENSFKKASTFTLPETYEDTTITVCDSTIFYFVTNDDSTSISGIQSGNFKDSNSPSWPQVTSMSIDNDASLVIKWIPSHSKDVYIYMLMYQNINKNSLKDGWYYFDSVPIDATSSSHIINPSFCSNLNETQYSKYLFKFALFAYDTCGNISKLYKADTTKIIVFPPILHDITFDSCSSISFSWNSYKSVIDSVSKYIIEYKNDKYSDTISVNESKFTINSLWITYHCEISKYYDELSNRTSQFRLLSINNSGDTSYTCWKEIYISTISFPPDNNDILTISSSINNDICKNIIGLKIDTKPKSDIKYLLSRTNNNDTTNIWSINKFPINQSDTSVIDVINNPEGSYLYKLTAIDKCGNIIGNSEMKSMYLTGNIDENNNNYYILHCNTINSTKYGNITYKIIRFYKNDIDSINWDNIENDDQYDYDISFYDEGSYASIYWQVKALNDNGNIINQSNTFTYTPKNIKLKMPNSFIPDSEYEINRRFGPMNTFDESSIRKYSLQIYNSLGNRIWWTDQYSSENKGNNDISRWNGKDKNTGRDINIGTYVYTISVEFNDTDRPQLTAKGTVTLFRQQ